MRKNLLALSFLLLVACDYQAQTPVPSLNKERTKTKATDALAFCKQHKYNTQYCILIDMSLHSGLSRMIVWDFAKDTIEYACPVSHGCCGNPWGLTLSKNAAQFSNKDGSHCSALGKYKIGSRGYSSWGIHVNYLMHGLDKTNNAALARQIVLHSWEEVKDSATYPQGTPEGWGCPAVSNNSMKYIDAKLKNEKVPVLMWIYN